MTSQGERLASDALTDEQRELLAYLLAEKELAVATPTIDAQPGDEAPLSDAQRGIWFLHQLEEDDLYNLPAVVHLRGPLDHRALEQSFQSVVDRHAILRSTFVDRDGVPVQIAAERLPVTIPTLDLSQVCTAEHARQVRTHALEEAATPFDLTRGPLFRATILRLAPERHVLLLTLHHLIADGWSLGIFLRELAAFYAHFTEQAPLHLPRLAIQYADYARWQRARDPAADLVYWKRELEDAPGSISLPTDRVIARETVSHRGFAHSRHLDPELVKQLRTWARAQNVTLASVLLAGFQTLLSRHSGQKDLVVGMPLANREPIETEPLIGLFVNTLPLRTRLDDHPTFEQLVSRVHQSTVQAIDHQSLPFERLVDALKLPRKAGHNPLFEVVFVYQNTPMPKLAIGRLDLEIVNIAEGPAKFDLCLSVEEESERLRLDLCYRTDLFEQSTIEKMLEQLETLFRSALLDPTAPVSRLRLLAPADGAQQLGDPAIENAPLFEHLFADVVERVPHGIALSDHAREMTYSELDQRSSALAEALGERGVGAGDLVGISIERSVELVVGLLGILKAGAAYVPLDPSYPLERIAFMIEDAGLRTIIGRAAPLAALSQPVFDADSWPTSATAWVPVPSDRRALAHVIYTSGSTGRPKGVGIEHRNVAALLAWAKETFDEDALAFVLASTSICFDLSVFEIFAPLSSGGAVILAANPLEPPRDPRISLINTVPSVVAELLAQGKLPRSARTINLAGELLPQSMVEQLYALPHVVEVNDLYGPSEDTTYSTHARRTRGGANTIGTAIRGSQAHVLDEWGEFVPPGVAGELYLGGAGVARGYLGRPRLTAERFVPDPFSNRPGARLYRTGDLVRLDKEGALEYRGRLDHQVKIRGVRIELQEIESVLAAHASVRECAVVAHRARLVAYVAGETEPSREALRKHLATRLPEVMIPSAFVFVTALPRNGNGKVDRKALPNPGRSRPHLITPYSAPATDEECWLTAMWSDVLGLDEPGVHDDLFALGADSISVVKVAAAVERRGFRLTPRQMFEHPTIAAQTALLTPKRQEAPRITATEHQLTPLQQQLLLHTLVEDDPALYSTQVLFRIRSGVEIELFRNGWKALIERHAALRTSFGWREQLGVRFEAGVELPLEVIDLRDMSATRRERALENLLDEDRSRGFELERAPLFRVYLIRLDEHESQVVFSHHHLLLDGWSTTILLDELGALLRGEHIFDHPLPQPLGDYLGWIAGQPIEESERFWRRQLATFESPTALGFVEKNDVSPRFLHGQEEIALAEEETRVLTEFARLHGLTLNTLVQGAFAILLGRRSGAHDVIFGVTVSGRSIPVQGVETLVGLLANTVPLRVQLERDGDIVCWLADLQKHAAAIAEHSHVTMQQLRNWTPRAADLQPFRLYDSVFVFENHPLPSAEFDDFDFREQTNTALLLYVLPGAQLKLRSTFDRRRFAAEDVRRALAQLTVILQELTRVRDVGGLSGLSEPERHQLLTEYSGRDVPASQTPVQELFIRRAQATPDAPALILGDLTLSYRALATRAQQIAAHLGQQGVGPEVRVGLCLEPSFDLIAAILGILQAGGIYVPIDPKWPATRKETIVREAALHSVIDADTVFEEVAEPGKPVDSRNGAYVVFTSGSTGGPKGVLIEHRSLTSYTQAAVDAYQLAAGDRVLQFASASFDASAEEIFPTLISGAALVLREDARLASFTSLARSCDEQQITVLNLPTAFWHVWVDALLRGDPFPQSLRLVIIGGEEAHREKLEAWKRIAGAGVRLINTYGPTEATIVATHFDTSEGIVGKNVPLGRPVPNVKAVVLDTHGDPCPIGVAGELFLGGVGLARGYLGQPALTAERFVPNPFPELATSRLYRSGDRARMLESGVLEFLGRVDRQVKIRGFRVEPQEVEVSLAACPHVASCAVIVEEDGDERRLIGCFTSEKEMPPVALRRSLLERLPEFMVPVRFVQLDALPLNSAGKIDRRALLRRVAKTTSATPMPCEPRSAIEKKLVELWCQVLRRERVGIHDDFFALGGHSLLATQLLSRALDAFDVDVSLKAMFGATTIAQQAALIESAPPQITAKTTIQPRRRKEKKQ